MVAPSPPPIIRKVNKILNDRNNPADLRIRRLRRGDWFFIFLSVMVVAIAVLDVAAAYKYPKPGPTVRIIIDPDPQSNAAPALAPEPGKRRGSTTRP